MPRTPGEVHLIRPVPPEDESAAATAAGGRAQGECLPQLLHPGNWLG